MALPYLIQSFELFPSVLFSTRSFSIINQLLLDHNGPRHHGMDSTVIGVRPCSTKCRCLGPTGKYVSCIPHSVVAGRSMSDSIVVLPCYNCPLCNREAGWSECIIRHRYGIRRSLGSRCRGTAPIRAC